MDGLGALLKEKVELLKDILAETEKQRELIESGEAEDLPSSLEARQALMRRVDELNVCIGGAAGGSAEVKTEIADVLRKIIDLDDANRKNAEALRRKLATDIKGANAEKSLLAYQQMNGSNNLYINRKG